MDREDCKTWPMLSIKSHFKYNTIDRMKREEWETHLWYKHESGVDIFMFDKVDLKKKVIGDREGNHTMINGSVLQEEMIILSVHASNNSAVKYVTQLF